MPGFRGQKFCDHDCYSQSLRRPIEPRFWSKVNKQGSPPSHLPHLGNCWLWTASTLGKFGHGQFTLPRQPGERQNRHIYAHRYSWELAHGLIPDGMSVLHRCDIPLCVRPEHLFLGTQADNLNDARAKGRLDESRPRTVKLAYEQRLAIFHSTERGIDLARRYGVSESAISVIRRGRFARPKAQPSRHKAS